MTADVLHESIPDLAVRFINSTCAHIFLTGKAGTGKTTFLKNLGARTHKSFVVVAPTGIAALNAGGVTIHSQFLLPLGSFIPGRNLPFGAGENGNFYTTDTLTRRQPLNSARKQVLRSIELLVIDEVSMLRADLLDAIDARLRAARGNYREPFGGVQLLLIGDLYQLPPVVKGNEAEILKEYYPSPWFYESRALREAGFVYIELDKIYRQQDADFIRLLNNLRNNALTQEDIDLLNAHVRDPNDDLSDVITLTTHNFKADSMNREALKRLESKSHIFEATVNGEFPEHIYPVQYKLELKEGAQIMFVRNDSEGQAYYNGKLATVKRISGDSVEVVMADSGEPFELKKERWENKRYAIDQDSQDLQEEVIGSFEQYPVRLAWAITVHKSQGLTFDRAVIDVRQAFADGQVYVALSRLRSLDGLILLEPVPPSVISTDRSVVSFREQHYRPSELHTVMKQSQRSFVGQIIDRTFDFGDLAKQIKYVTTTLTETVLKNVDTSLPILEELRNTLLSEKDNTLRYRNQLHRLLDEQRISELLERLQKGSAYYTDIIWKTIENLLSHQYGIRDQKRIKTYHNNLEELDQLFTKKLLEIAKIPLLADAVLGDRSEYKFDEVQEALNQRRLAIITALREQPSANKGTSKKRGGKSKKGSSPSTIEITLNYFKEGMSVADIARERGLVPGTIEGHLARAVGEGALDITRWMTDEDLKDISSAASGLSEGFGITDLFKATKGKYSYGKLRAALFHLQREQEEVGSG
ncbi:MAG: helix-turn-helix domain-containing protein [Cyclobacteriaceae bacterium]|nr:helix-turn-helix domain-containing protein [Cyclobacteriaceae bacterium]